MGLWLCVAAGRGACFIVASPLVVTMGPMPPPPASSRGRFVLRPGVVVDLARARLHHDGGDDRSLTAREVELLAYLQQRVGQDVDFAEVHREVWGHGPQVVSRAAQNTVHRLRRKLEVDPSRPEHLVTVHGGGVRLVCAPEVAAAPAAPTAQLLGRDELVASVREQLGPGQVVTLSGLGGIGKTTMARAVVRRDGGLWVALAAADDGAGVTAALAAALEVPVRSDEQVGRALAGSGVTRVVLDNAEQVAAAVRDRITAWREAAPQVGWLVTSRVRLGVVGEQVVVVPPLAVPEGDDESLRAPAVQLYLARAGAHVGPEEAAEVAALVRELAGVPLAIELAAARASLLGPSALRQRLGQGLALLKGRGGGRHGAMEAALRWSWSLLSAGGRQGLARLAVFLGPIRLEAAEAVLQPVDAFALDLLQELVDASLLARQGTRLVMPALVRAFARAQQEVDDDDVARRHADVLAAHAEGELFPWAVAGGDDAAATEQDEDLADLEAAARWAVEAGEPVAVRLAQVVVAARARRGPLLHPRRWWRRRRRCPGGRPPTSTGCGGCGRRACCGPRRRRERRRSSTGCRSLRIPTRGTSCCGCWSPMPWGTTTRRTASSTRAWACRVRRPWPPTT